MNRTIYLGSSAGGFAALCFSFRHPGSVAVVMVPQTNLRRHGHSASVEFYLENCWAGKLLDCLEVCTDVTELYARGFDNAVIYVQSAGDTLHNARQMLPFLRAVYGDEGDGDKQFMLHSGFWGTLGHGGADESRLDADETDAGASDSRVERRLGTAVG